MFGQSEKRGMSHPLLQELCIDRLKLPNRVVFTAHRTNFGRKGRLNDRHAAY